LAVTFKKGGKVIVQLPGGQLYYESLLDLDSDGSRFATQDRTGQQGTSLTHPDGRPLDADAIPYFVMPKRFADRCGIRLGDVAAVVHRGHLEFAVLGDYGPSTKLGEGSIALHRALGHEVIRNGRFHDEAIDEGVITIVFPRSGNRTPQTPEQIRAIGKELFVKLGGILPRE
jgi:hypothetical protein